MKIITILFLQALLMGSAMAQQNVGIGTTTPQPSAALDISSTTKGLLVPRMTSMQRMSIASPAKGLIVFDNQSASYWYHTGTAWKEIDSKNYVADDSLIVGQQSGSPAGYNLTGNINQADSSGLLYDSGGPAFGYGNNEDYVLTIPYSANQLAVEINVFNSAMVSPDSLIITDSYGHYYALTGSTIGVYRLYDEVKIRFKSNSTGTANGFMLRWNKIFLGTGNAPYNSDQLTGWLFDPVKLYMRGGDNGNNNWHPDSSGTLSFAFGSRVQAKGMYSVAAGYNSKAQGENSSVSLGWQTMASGNYGTVAIGDQAKATGNSGATALGSNTLASGDWGATALVKNARASGESSFAAGNEARATGQWSAAVGFNARASGSFSVALGNSVAAGSSSVALGSGATASGNSSLATGYLTEAQGYLSTAMGRANTAIGQISFAAGEGTEAKSYAGFVVGTNNDNSYFPATDNPHSLNRIFEIGNGIYPIRSNAVTVLQNGNVGINTVTPSYKLHINGSMRIDGNINVGENGIIRNSAPGQLKMVTTAITINQSASPIPAGATISKTITWSQAFTTSPVAYIGNILSGAGGWAEVVLTIAATNSSGATLYIYNPRNIAVSPSFVFNVIAMGE